MISCSVTHQRLSFPAAISKISTHTHTQNTHTRRRKCTDKYSYTHAHTEKTGQLHRNTLNCVTPNETESEVGLKDLLFCKTFCVVPEMLSCNRKVNGQKRESPFTRRSFFHSLGVSDTHGAKKKKRDYLCQCDVKALQQYPFGPEVLPHSPSFCSLSCSSLCWKEAVNTAFNSHFSRADACT